MSLINQVLADLDQRKSGQPLPANGVLTGTVPASSVQISKWMYYLPMGGAALVAAVVAVLFWPGTENNQITAPAVEVDSSHETASVRPKLAADPDEAMLNLAPQLSLVEEKEKPEPIAGLRLEQLLERPIAKIEQPVRAPVVKMPEVFHPVRLRDVWVKEVKRVAQGYDQQVKLLLSGNVGMAMHDTTSLREEDVSAKHVIDNPVLALDSRMAAYAKPEVTSRAVSKSSSTSSTSKPVSVKQRLADSNMKSLRLEIQPNKASPQNRSIRQLTNVQRAEEIYQQALVLNAKGDLFPAIAQLRQALQIDASHLKARYTLAALLINTDQSDAALKELVSGINIEPGYAPFAKLYGRLKAVAGELDDAVAVMERAREGAQGDPEYYAQLAAIYQQQGRHSEAIAYFQQALRWQSTEGAWWMGLGISLEQQRHYRDAALAYRKADATGTLSDTVLAYVQSRIQALE